MQTRLMAFFVSQSALNPAFDPVFLVQRGGLFLRAARTQANFGNDESDVKFLCRRGKFAQQCVDSTVQISLLMFYELSQNIRRNNCNSNGLYFCTKIVFMSYIEWNFFKKFFGTFLLKIAQDFTLHRFFESKKLLHFCSQQNNRILFYQRKYWSKFIDFLSIAIRSHYSNQNKIHNLILNPKNYGC